jgi:hypothetical protein
VTEQFDMFGENPMNIDKAMGSKGLAQAAVALVLVATYRLVAQLAGADAGVSGSVDELFGFGAIGLLPLWAVGHCDGLDGPVVTLARKALETGNVKLVLPWVQKRDESDIRRAFDATLSARKAGPAARDLVDMYFFETLVRVHRAGEGAPYTGIKPAGRDLGQAIPAADRALEDGSIDRAIKIVTDAAVAGIHRHFERAVSRKDFDRDDVEAGRDYVEAYVAYVHYVERLYEAAVSAAHGHYPQHEHRGDEAHA